MLKRSRKPAKDLNQLARSIVDQATGVSTPKKTPAPNTAKPPSPKKRRDVQDIERADSEGMAQPQGIKPKKKNPAAVALGRMGGLKGGPARAKKLGKAKLSASARKAAQARWSKEKT